MGGLLAFVPDADTPGKADMSGAFQPEALKFVRHHGQTAAAVRRFAAHGPLEHRKDDIKSGLRANALASSTFSGGPLLSTLAFFCHGFRAGLQCGYQKSSVLALAQLVSQYCEKDCRLLLYACDTARDDDNDTQDDRKPGPGGENGFADALRDACDALGVRAQVVAHASRGHCTMNPDVRLFAPGGTGGEWYVEPGTELFSKWRRVLHEPLSTLRFRFPFMTPEAVRAELAGPPRVA